MGIREQADAEFVKDRIEGINADSVRHRFKVRYGVGWQKKLAEVLGIAPSTLSGWLRAEELPLWGKLALGAILYGEEEEGQELVFKVQWKAIQKGSGSYQVVTVEEDGAVARVIADSIQDEADAVLIAAAPNLYETFNLDSIIISDGFDGDPGFQHHVDRINLTSALIPYGYRGDDPELSGKWVHGQMVGSSPNLPTQSMSEAAGSLREITERVQSDMITQELVRQSEQLGLLKQEYLEQSEELALLKQALKQRIAQEEGGDRVVEEGSEGGSESWR